MPFYITGPFHSLSKGNVETLIKTAMIMEQIGSAMCQSKRRMSKAEMITPTLPSVSANMCKNTP